MEKALKLAWIKRFQDDSQASWKIIPNHIMHKHGSLTFLTKCNFATNTLAHENLPIFYEKILNYWSEFKTPQAMILSLAIKMKSSGTIGTF